MSAWRRVLEQTTAALLRQQATQARLRRRLRYEPAGYELARSRGSYLSATTLRLTFIVGVSSPPSWERSPGRISNFLTCSTRANFSFTWSMCAWIEARTSAFVGERGGVVGASPSSSA